MTIAATRTNPRRPDATTEPETQPAAKATPAEKPTDAPPTATPGTTALGAGKRPSVPAAVLASGTPEPKPGSLASQQAVKDRLAENPGAADQELANRMRGGSPTDRTIGGAG